MWMIGVTWFPFYFLFFLLQPIILIILCGCLSLIDIIELFYLFINLEQILLHEMRASGNLYFQSIWEVILQTICILYHFHVQHIFMTLESGSCVWGVDVLPLNEQFDSTNLYAGQHPMNVEGVHWSSKGQCENLSHPSVYIYKYVLCDGGREVEFELFPTVWC